MARPLRIEYSGALYHVTSRGNEKKSIFKDDKDRKIFLEVLQEVNERFYWLCHAYTLMDNHYHLVIETPEGNLSQGMRQLNGVYTQAFNKRHQRVGHLFQGRYKAILIDRECYLLDVCRYIVLNPLRANAVKSLRDWKWSSYGATAGFEKPHSCLTTDWILGQFGTKNKSAARERYRKFITDGVGEDTIWCRVKGQIALGEKEFIERFMNYLSDQEDIKEIPKSQRYVHRPKLDNLFEEKIVKDKNTRNRRIRDAVEKWGYSQREVADYLKMHYSTISRLITYNQMSKYKT